ncbi:MAG: TatD family hydrolase [candidate division Zixibacteria bacterium]|nr:TatD family hydrolase [candidate division Zixibacteria bacterium]MBU1469943.1 TatD family hydrolase [candidate division Zixibacteria bacterium]MBU2626962.1 TatD family hydrolase [candidate division Zixibacteria bacterium]
MLIDAHAHLDRYDDTLDEAIEQINSNRIFTISNSMDIPSYERNLKIAQKCRLILPTFGVHPWNAPQYTHRLNDLKAYLERSAMYGEIGLDYFFVGDVSAYPAQREVFEFFLRAAAKHNKIVNIHTKGAEADVLHMLQQYKVRHVIVHWYSGPFDVLRSMLSFGVYFSIGVELLRSRHIQAIVRELPMGQILTETDNPGGYDSLEGVAGMPHLILDVVGKLAELKETTVEQIMLSVQSNFVQLIRNAPSLRDSFLRVCDELSNDTP